MVDEVQTEGLRNLILENLLSATKRRMPQVTYWIFNVAMLARINLDAHTSRPYETKLNGPPAPMGAVFVAAAVTDVCITGIENGEAIC